MRPHRPHSRGFPKSWLRDHHIRRVNARPPAPVRPTAHRRLCDGQRRDRSEFLRRVAPERQIDRENRAAAGWLTTVMSPPISVASDLQMARPRPEPPKRRERVWSACAIFSNTRSCFGGEVDARYRPPKAAQPARHLADRRGDQQSQAIKPMRSEFGHRCRSG